MPMLPLLAALSILVGCAGTAAKPAVGPVPPLRQDAQGARTAFEQAREGGDTVTAEAAARSWCASLEQTTEVDPAEAATARAALAWALARQATENESTREAAHQAAREAAAFADEAPPLACELLFEAWFALDEFTQGEVWAERCAQGPRTQASWEPAYPFAMLGYAQWSAEDELAADRCYARASELLTEETSPRFAAWVRLEFANTRIEFGDYPAALALFERVEQDPVASSNQEIAVQVRLRHGSLLVDLGRFEQAASVLEEALSAAHAASLPELVVRVCVLGVDLAQRSRDELALRAWLSLLEQGDPALWDNWTLKTVRAAESRVALRDGDLDRAALRAEQAIQSVDPADPREWLLMPWLAQARVDLARSEFERVESALNAAAEQLDTPAVRARGGARVHLRSRYAEWLQLAADLGWARTQAARVADRATAVSAAWAEVDRWKARTLAESFVSTVASDAELAPHSVLLDFVGGGDALYVFRRVTATEEMLLLGARAPIELRLTLYHAVLSDPTASTPLAELAATGHALYQDLLADALPPGATRAWIVPEADWPGTPFSALISALPPAGEELRAFSQLHFAIEDFAFTHAPSRAIGLRLSSAPSPIPLHPALIFADPRCEDGRWPALPGTREEALAVRAAIGGELLLGSEATKAALLARLSGSRIVHLATHAIADPVAPERSRIACSGSGEASDLTLAELRERRLSAEVVVLSACETAGGRALRGEGTQSLAAGFLSAGAQSVVATLWPVFDEDAALLMKHFYAAGGGAGARAEDALRAAQLALLHGDPPTIASAEHGVPVRGQLEGGRPLTPARGLAAPLAGHPLRWASFLLFGAFTAGA